MSQMRAVVMGGGSWGTALSIVANRAGSAVTLLTRNHSVISAIRERRTNDIYMPGVFIDPAIQTSDDLGLTKGQDIIIIAVPSHCLRMACIGISDFISDSVPVVIASKGIERGSLALMSEVATQILPRNPIAILSGPNFADEAARGLPTATTIAIEDQALGEKLLYAIGGRLFRPYLTDDLIGTQIGGAVKNVIAIAVGIVMGRSLGENAKAALITRGFAEIARLCVAKGGKYETLMGLSGIGDLMLTCGTGKSRNTKLGMMLGQGIAKDAALNSESRVVYEGVITAESVHKLARKLNVGMPICDAVQRILHEGADIDAQITDLLERPFVIEHH